MLAAQPCAAAFYGTEVTQLTAAQQTQLAGAAMQVLWGSSRKRGCREIVFTLFAPGHLVDPQQALTYRRLVAFQRMVALRPDMHGSDLDGDHLRNLIQPPHGAAGRVGSCCSTCTTSAPMGRRFRSPHQ